MRQFKVLLIGMLLCLSVSAFAQENAIPLSGMAKITLTDGRTLYGAVAGEYVVQRNRLIDRVTIRFVSEPTFIQFSDEAKFNAEFDAPVELGISGIRSLTARSVISAIIPGFGAVSILTAGNFRDSEWTDYGRHVTITGTAIGFNLSID